MFFLLSLFSLVYAQENTTSFIISEFTNSNRAYYSCDSVKNETTDFLKHFTVKDLEVTCSGGYNPIGVSTSAFVSTTFNVEIPEVREVIKLKGDTNCHLVSQIARGLKKRLKINKIKGSHCWTPNSSYQIELVF
ncbi:MAG: hypothetical protein JNM93_02940 [Bacteriovoracaceae bacterium]|nr:hypothetical protein [Bacteriovoracaceae bacterium]